MPLCSVSAQTSGSENVYGIAYASSSAGTCDSRPKPATPSAMLNTRSQRSPATSRAASAFTWPIRTTSWPSDCERARDGLDRDLGIELGDGVLAEAEREIVGLQIVGEADPQSACPLAAQRAASAAAELSAGIRVAALLAPEVPELEVVAVATEHGVGQHRDLAAAAGRVHDVVRHRIAGRIAAQLRDQLEALLDRSPEMRRAADRIALIEIVRPDSDLRAARGTASSASRRRR